MPRISIGHRSRQAPLRGGTLLALLLSYGLVFAADPAPAARYRIDQPSRPLSESLRSIAGQTGISVLFEPGAVSGRMSAPVSGQFSAAEAIVRALNGTGLAAEVMGDGSIVVKLAPGPEPISQAKVPSVQAVHSSNDKTETSSGAGLTVLAQAHGLAGTQSATDAGTSGSGDTSAGVSQLTPVEITGSRLKRIDSDGPMPVNVYTRADIEKSGQPTLERFLSSLNEASVSSGEGMLSKVQVPASNAFNPFGAPVNVTARLGLDNGSEGFVRNTNFTRALAGIRGDLGRGWDFEATLSTTRDDGDRRLLDNTVNTAARTAALASSDPTTALNPFTAGAAASSGVLSSIWSDTLRESHGRKDEGSAFVRGSPITLWAGPVDVIAGAELSHDRYETAQPGLSILDSRTSSAFYGEARVPLLRSGAPATGQAWDIAALTVAARHDRYSDFGGANTFQAGAELRPTRTLLLRASAATSFKPPTLLETSVDDTSLPSDDYGLVDPARGNAPILGASVLRTANSDLKPEKGRAYSFGAVWEPDSAAGARLAATAWHVKINGLISLLWPQVTLNNESLFPGAITRGPTVNGVPGAVTQILYSEVNFGSVDTSGVDMEISQSWKAAGAKWTAGASATRTTRYDVAIAPGAPIADRLGVRAPDYWSPRWKGRLSAGVEEATWSVGITSRYLGSYLDTAPSNQELGNYWLHDLAGSLDLKRLGWGFQSASAAKLSLGIVNVLNRLPQYADTSPYYDVTQADWRGRYASLLLSVNW
jgi:hypothetical protein